MFSLYDFLNLHSLQHYKFLTKPVNYNQIEVQHIAVIEIPVDDFIRPNEIILTTGIGCLDDDLLFLQFVKNIYESKAAAIVISIKDNTYVFPKKIIDFADEVSLPIIQIPWLNKFSVILEDTFGQLRKKEDERTAYYGNLRTELLERFLKKLDLTNIIVYLEEVFKTNMVITDINYKPQHDLDNGHTKESFTMGAYKIFLPIQVNHHMYGFIFVEKHKKIEASLIEAFEDYLILPLSLWFDKEQTLLNKDMLMKRDFVWNLAYGKYDSLEESIAQSTLIGIQLQDHYLCVVGQLCSAQSLDVETPYNYINFLELESFARNRECLLSFNDKVILIYYPYKDDTSLFELNLFLDQVEDKMNQSKNHMYFKWGVSKVINEVNAFKQTYQQARITLQTLPKQIVYHCRMTYEQSLLSQFISMLAENKNTSKIAEDVLKPLLYSDKNKNTDYVHTLKQFSRNNYNISETARSMNLHRQSLIYRLKRIEELTAYSLNDHDTLFLLELSLRTFSF